MKRILLSLAASSLIVSGAVAQGQVSSNDHTIPAVLSKHDPVSKSRAAQNLKKSSVTTIWTEDFANGIPSTWTNAGFDVDPATGNFNPNPLCLWEYRGPNTTPSNGTGSRGAYASPNDPILSPSTGNGFIIFDSDWLDNNGIAGAFGTGNSASPHYGTLTTDTIDLSGYPGVQLEMSSYARTFFGDFYVAVSGDGGLTFPDTVEFHPTLAVNGSTDNGAIVAANISNTAGGSANVVLQIIFDGIPGNANGNGYYFWCIDDISISEIPANSFKFTDWQGAPERDVIYPANHPRYGNPQVNQAAQLPVSFDCNVLNFGSADQYNVRLNVDIIDDSNGSVVTTLQSPAIPVLASGDTGTYVDLTTATSWTPSAVGVYNAVYYVTSDSVNADTPYDTTTFRVNDLTHAADFSTLDNTIGIVQGVLGLAQAFTFPSDVDTNGYVAIDQISMYISSISDTTGSIIVEVYDTAGFAYGAGGGPVGAPFSVKAFPLNSSNIGRLSAIDMTTNGRPLVLPANRGYLVVVNLLSTSGFINIGNDQTVAQPAGVIGMLYNDGSWYSGFSNSRILSNLVIRMRVVRGIGLEEAAMKQNSISMFPNPSTNGMVSFELGLGGNYNIEVTTLTGQRVYAETVSVNGGEVLERNFSDLQKGAYLVNFTSEEIQMTKKLVIE